MYGQFFILFGLILVGYYCNKRIPADGKQIKKRRQYGHARDDSCDADYYDCRD